MTLTNEQLVELRRAIFVLYEAGRYKEGNQLRQHMYDVYGARYHD